MDKKEFDLQSEDVFKLALYLSNGQTVMLSCCNASRSIKGISTDTWVSPTSFMPFLITAAVGSGGKEGGLLSYRVSYSLINETKEFGINVPTMELAEAVVKVGTTHSDEVDKFAEAALTPMDSKVIKAPLIAECFLNIECKVIHQFVTGDHTVFVGEPVVVHMNDDLFVDGKFSDKYRNESSFVHYEDVMSSLY